LSTETVKQQEKSDKLSSCSCEAKKFKESVITHKNDVKILFLHYVQLTTKVYLDEREM